jgi:hypothetical protein
MKYDHHQVRLIISHTLEQLHEVELREELMTHLWGEDQPIPHRFMPMTWKEILEMNSWDFWIQMSMDDNDRAIEWVFNNFVKDPS